MTTVIEQLLIEQMTEVHAQHPALELTANSEGRVIVRGAVGFRIEHDGLTLEDTYEIELQLPDTYPASAPIVFETGNKIPKAFGHFMAAGNLCLGAPVEIRRRFARSRSLIGFINEQVIPYLFSHSFKRDHGRLPFGELFHGYEGLLQYYVEHFGTDPITALKFLKYLADDFAPPSKPCPCASGKPLGECHGPKLDELRPHYPAEMFETELRELIKVLQQADIDLPESRVIPMQTWKNRQRRLRRKRGA